MSFGAWNLPSMLCSSDCVWRAGIQDESVIQKSVWVTGGNRICQELPLRKTDPRYDLIPDPLLII